MEAHIKALFNQEILKQAGKFYDVDPVNIFEIGGFENFIYGYKKNETEYILRISHSSHRTFDQLLAELDFVNYLADHEANVSIPVFSINHNLVESIHIEGSYFTVSSYIKANGRRPKKEDFNSELLYNYGKTIGEFHALTKDYYPDKGFNKRFNWDSDPLFIHARSYLNDNDQIIYDRFKELIQRINQLPVNKDNYGLIHTDIHMGNFFIEQNNLCVFDFDDCSYMWFVSDIAISLFYYLDFVMRDDLHEEENANHFMTHFMKGYLSVNKLSKLEISSMQDFLKLREIVLYIVLYRSVDMESNNFAKQYVDKYRDRIINNIPFVNIDFEKYIQ